ALPASRNEWVMAASVVEGCKYRCRLVGVLLYLEHRCDASGSLPGRAKKNPADHFGPRDAVGAPAFSFGGREQAADVLVAQLFLAVVGVDHQGGAAGGDPHQVIAELVDRLQLRMLLQHAEVSVALGLDHERLGLGVVAL